MYKNEEICNSHTQSPLGDVSISGITLSERPKTSAERQERLALLIDAGLVEPELRNKPDEEQDRAIRTFEMIQKMGDTPLFGDLPLQSAPDSTGFTNTKQDIHVG
jgi:hypothetical protein